MLILCALLTGCSGEENDRTGASTSRSPPVPVSVARVIEQQVPVQVEAIATVEPYATVSVKSRIDGQVAAVEVHDGEFVKQGQLLFSMDARPFQAVLQQTEATLAKDKALAANAEAFAQRQEELFKQKSISPAERDQAKYTAQSLAAQVRADEGLVENARLQLNYCSIRSPIDGKAGTVLVNLGNVVKANDTAMLTINQMRPIYVSFAVPEQHLSAIRTAMSQGQPQVQAIIPPTRVPTEEGTLTFIDNQVDMTTGTIRLKGTFPNANAHLWPGQYVNAVLTLGEQPDALLIPSQAIEPGQSGPYVFVVKDDLTVEARPIIPGRSIDGQTIITQGLRPGEQVVTDGQLRLVPGARVQIKPPPATTQASAV